MTWVVDMEEEAMEEDILPKFAVIVERQDIPLIHAIKKRGFSPHLKFKNQNHHQSHTTFHNINFNNNEQNHEGSKSEVESQQICFTPEQYQTLLALSLIHI